MWRFGGHIFGCEKCDRDLGFIFWCSYFGQIEIRWSAYPGETFVGVVVQETRAVGIVSVSRLLNSDYFNSAGIVCLDDGFDFAALDGVE
jgi:hypothetical protein